MFLKESLSDPEVHWIVVFLLSSAVQMDIGPCLEGEVWQPCSLALEGKCLNGERSDLGPAGRGYTCIDITGQASLFPSWLTSWRSMDAATSPARRGRVSPMLEATERWNLHAWSPPYTHSTLLGTQGTLEETASLLPHQTNNLVEERKHIYTQCVRKYKIMIMCFVYPF